MLASVAENEERIRRDSCGEQADAGGDCPQGGTHVRQGRNDYEREVLSVDHGTGHQYEMTSPAAIVPLIVNPAVVTDVALASCAEVWLFR
jgi:hypothetical protein